MKFGEMEVWSGSDKSKPLKNESAGLLEHKRPASADKAGHYKLVGYRGDSPVSKKEGNPENGFVLVSYADDQKHPDGEVDEAEQLRDKVRQLEFLYKDIQQVAADMLEVK
ncbi:MAG: hypothetical protein Q8M12_01875, partial [bacterium]|nr:hypothetical protein [bacterium]